MFDWLSSLDHRVVNQTFLDKLASPDAVAELGSAVASYVKDKLRELAIVRGILHVEHFHPEQLDRNANTGFFHKTVDIEPDTTAYTMPIHANAPGSYVQHEKADLHFGKITTPKFSKSRDELMATEMPITKVIEANGVRDVQEVEDYLFFGGCEDAVYGLANGTKRIEFQDTFEDGTLRERVDKVAITDTAALLEDNERRAHTIVMSYVDIRKFTGQDAAVVGDDLSSKVTVEGWRWKEIYGMNLLPSIKSKSRVGKVFNGATQISLTKQGLGPVDKGRFWIFDKAERVGKFMSLEEGRFHIETHFGFVYWQLEQVIAMALLNTGSVAVCDLRLATPGAGSGYRTSTTAPNAAAYDTSLIP